MSECARCAALLESFQAMDRDLAGLEDPEPGPHLRRRFRAAAQHKGRWPRMDWGVLRARAGQLAAAGLVILLSVGLWLEISPEETLVACMAYRERGLVIRDLETGTERETTRLDSAEPYQGGHIVWSPDSSALALTLAIEPCAPGKYGDAGIWARSTSIVWVDADTLEQRTLVQEDERRFISVGWGDAGTIALEDANGEPWRLDAATGELTAGEQTASRRNRTARPASLCI